MGHPHRVMKRRGITRRARPEIDISDVTVGVLYGGDSRERNVSYQSGEAVIRALLCAGLDVIPVPVNDEFRPDQLLDRGIDIAFLALHGGDGEDGTLQAELDELAIPYTGSGARASRAAMDKAWSKSIFRACGIPTPAYTTFRVGQNIDALELPADFPLVVKPSAGGSSIGVTIVQNRNELAAAVQSAHMIDPHLIIEQYVQGREITIGILDRDALPVVELVPQHTFYDYDAKYSDDAGTNYLCPAPLDEMSTARAVMLAKKTHRSLGCRDLSRTDVIVDTAGMMWVLETNTLPGMTSHSLLPKAAEAAGVSFIDLCVKIVRMVSRREMARGSRRMRAVA